MPFFFPFRRNIIDLEKSRILIWKNQEGLDFLSLHTTNERAFSNGVNLRVNFCCESEWEFLWLLREISKRASCCEK